MKKTDISILYENKALQALASSLIGSWVWDIPSDTIYADDTLADIFSLSTSDTRDGLPLKEFINLIHPADRSLVNATIEESVANRVDYDAEYRVINKDGEERWVVAKGRVEVDDSGDPVRLPGVILDITDRKQSELRRLRAERQLSFMADSMPQLVWVADADGRVDYFNKRWHDYTGLNIEESIGDGWQDAVHPDDKEEAARVWSRSMNTGEPYEIQYRLFFASNRTYRWNIARAIPFKDDDGTVLSWYGTCTDVDEQKHSAIIQTFLAKASKRLSSSLNYIKTLKAVTDLSVPHISDWCSVDLMSEEGEWEQVAVSHIDPKRVSEVIKYRQIFPADIKSKAGLGKVIRTKKTEFYPYFDSSTIKSAVKDKSSQKFLASLNLRSIIITPIIDRDEVIGAITFALSDTERYFNRDDLKMAEKIASRVALAIANARLYESSLREIQARKKLEKDLIIEQQKLESRVIERTKQLNLTNQGLVEEIRRRQEIEEEMKAYSEELSRSNQELQDFAYVASHDLQEPLRKIQAFGDILKTEYSDKLGEGADYLERMLGASSRMSNLIHDLLSFSRVSTKNNKHVNVDLNAIVSDVLIDLETSISDSKAKLEICKLPSVHADPTHMRQLFQNLISNAIKFRRSKVKPIIKISSRDIDDQQVEIRVEDNGIGFDNKYQEKIFSVFQRLHGREAYDGTGIGLAVCRKIVHRYGGTIFAESKEGKGSVFIIQMPSNNGGSDD